MLPAAIAKYFLAGVCGVGKKLYLCLRENGRGGISRQAEIAQLVEHDLAKVGVASSSLVFRSQRKTWGSFPDVFLF